MAAGPELVLMPLMFVLISTGNHGPAMPGLSVATVPHCRCYAALAGMPASRFPANVRYTGISLCYQMCGTLLGGTTPVIGQFLLNRTGSITAVICYAVFQVLLTLGCMLLLLKRPDHDRPAGETADGPPRAEAVAV